MVYITAAHPSDVRQMESNVKDKVVFASPRSEQERGFVAGACVRKLGIEIPAVLDEFGNSTERAYTAWPDRLYLIDASGRVAYTRARPGLSASALKRRSSTADPVQIPAAQALACSRVATWLPLFDWLRSLSGNASAADRGGRPHMWDL